MVQTMHNCTVLIQSGSSIEALHGSIACAMAITVLHSVYEKRQVSKAGTSARDERAEYKGIKIRQRQVGESRFAGFDEAEQLKIKQPNLHTKCYAFSWFTRTVVCHVMHKEPSTARKSINACNGMRGPDSDCICNSV